MKNPQVFVGAGFKPALRRKIDLIRPGSVLGGFKTRPLYDNSIVIAVSNDGTGLAVALAAPRKERVARLEGGR